VHVGEQGPQREQEPDIEVVAEAADGDQAVAGALETRPDLVLMDTRMPVLDGIEAVVEPSTVKSHVASLLIVPGAR
jgi:YesN/AraC family two-component response regulator